MESKNLMMMMHCILVLWLSSIVAKCDIEKDREKCANDLVGLATCLPYVSGESKSPPTDCCTGLKTVLQKSPQCICLLVKDRNDPTLGLKINSTLALSLPSQCHLPANISACPSLLHLAPNSPDAKVFEDFANSGHQGNSTSASPITADSSSGKTAATTTADERSDGGMAKRWLGIEIVIGPLVTMMVAHNLLNL